MQDKIPMKPADYYWALQVKTNATTEQITSGYKRLKPYYQDLVDKGLPHYTELLNLVENGYQTLTDPEKRKKYDEEHGFPTEEDKSGISERDKTMKLLQESIDLIKKTDEILAGIGKNGNSDSDQAPPDKKKPLHISLPVQILIFLFANLLVFWLNYIASPGGIAWGVGGVCALILFGAISAIPKIRGDLKERTIVVRLVILSLCLIATNFITYFNFQKQELYVDNQSGFDVLVKVDEEPLVEVRDYKYQLTEIRIGEHTIKTFKKGTDSLLESFIVKIEWNDRSLYNVLTASEYITGRKSYAERSPLDWINGRKGESFPEEEIKKRWIPLTYSYIFERPPSTITIKKKITDMDPAEATRSYIIRKYKQSME